MNILEGVTVIELAEGIAVPFCAKLLGDLGAEVVKIEPPHAGDPSRAAGPFPSDDPSPESSGLYLYLNTGKRSVTLDMTKPRAAGVLRALAARADLLVQDESPSAALRRGYAYDTLAGWNPALVVLDLVAFGAPGPYADHKATPLNLFHAGSEASVLPGGGQGGGSPDREPVAPSLPVSEYDCGWTAAIAAMGALMASRASGQGQHVEVSKFEAMAALGRIRLVSWLGDEALQNRWTNRYAGAGTYACKDGFIQLLPSSKAHWKPLLDLAGVPDMLDDPRYDFERRQFTPEIAQEVHDRISAGLAKVSKDEAYQTLGRNGAPVGLFATVADLLESEQHRVRRFFRDVDHPQAGRLRHPALPFQLTSFDPTPAPAPGLGAETDDVLAGAGFDAGAIGSLRKAGVV